MAGQYTSASKQVIAHVRAQAAAIANRHAQVILKNAQANAPQVGHSLGYATDALKASGHVVLAGSEGRRRNENAYDLALSDAIYAREQNAKKTKAPGLVDPLTNADFLPRYEIPEVPAVAKAAVYFPIRYAMALELGFTLKGETHPQAFFLLHATQAQQDAFFADCGKLLDSLANFSAPPFKIPLTAEQKEMRARSRFERSIGAQFKRENGQLGKYGPFESFGEMLEFSGERRGRGQGETFGEAFERVERAALAAWEHGGFGNRRRS